MDDLAGWWTYIALHRIVTQKPTPETSLIVLTNDTPINLIKKILSPNKLILIQ